MSHSLRAELHYLWALLELRVIIGGKKRRNIQSHPLNCLHSYPGSISLKSVTVDLAFARLLFMCYIMKMKDLSPGNVQSYVVEWSKEW